jgi:polyketide biosynthesis acyl carrier protein
MNQEQVFAIVKSKVIEVLGNVSPEQITPEISLVDLGANSIDRVEVAMYSMEALGLAIPRNELQGIQNLKGLVQIFCRYLEA